MILIKKTGGASSRLCNYKIFLEVIKNSGEVILFGSTDVKVKLFNSLSLNHRFSKIKIEMKQADKMSTNQQHAFVREHFQNV